MKQGIMRKTAILLIITLMAGVLCALATIRANADSPGGQSSIYADDLREYFLNIKPDQSTNINRFFNLLDLALDNDNNYYACALFNDGDWMISIYTSGNLSMSTWYSYNAGSGWNGISRNPNSQNINVSKVGYLFYDGTLTLDFSSSNQGLIGPIAFDFNNPGTSLNYNAYPNTYNNANYWVYTSRNILSGNMGYSLSANFFLGSSVPPILPFTMVQFQIGDRYFITLQDQSLFTNFDPVTEDGEYFWELKYNNNFPEDNDAVYPVTILWSMLYRLSADLSQYVPNVQNIGYFLYAYEITDLVQSGVYFTIDSGEIWSVYTTEGGGRTDTLLYKSDSVLSFNSPYDPEEPTQQDQAWQNFTNYYNTYNTTHVVPENLGEVLFGLTGTKCFPVQVEAPASIIHAVNQNSFDGESYFQYHFPFNNNPALNYDILDVCVTSEQSLIANFLETSYSIRWWYDDSLTPSYTTIKDVVFMNLFEMYDIVIIVSDPEGQIHNSSKSYVYTGDSNLGFQYVETPLTGAHDMNGFAFVTKKAIQKQLLFNFNDGITKTYKLMCDYIEERGKWDDSFLLWSASIFQQLDSCNGKLENIKNAIIDLNSIVTAIKEAVNKIAIDPDPNNTSPWYLSLWNFITQFEPSNDQISDAIDLLDDNLDDIPLLPALTPVPALPTLGG